MKKEFLQATISTCGAIIDVVEQPAEGCIARAQSNRAAGKEVKALLYAFTAAALVAVALPIVAIEDAATDAYDKKYGPS